jgi:hypothetical protein
MTLTPEQVDQIKRYAYGPADSAEAAYYGLVAVSYLKDLLAERERLVAEVNSLKEHIGWMSGASDFAPDGQAHEGWLKVRAEVFPALARGQEGT